MSQKKRQNVTGTGVSISQESAVLPSLFFYPGLAVNTCQVSLLIYMLFVGDIVAQNAEAYLIFVIIDSFSLQLRLCYVLTASHRTTSSGRNCKIVGPRVVVCSEKGVRRTSDTAA